MIACIRGIINIMNKTLNELTTVQRRVQPLLSQVARKSEYAFLVSVGLFSVGCSLPKAAKRDAWWTLFKDKKLNEIIGQVRSSNEELKAAYARVKQSRANVRLSRSEYNPNISISPSITRTGSSDDVNFDGSTANQFRVPFDVTWEIDLFGRIRRSAEAVSADYESSYEDLNDLRLSLEADAAARYFNLRALDGEIEIVQSEIASRVESLKFIQERFELGTISQLDVSRAKTELAINKAELAALKRARVTEEAAIALLAGKQATSFKIAYAPLKAEAPRIPRAIPSELLRARPDIRSAERQLASANAQIGVATASFYPSISLSGSVGLDAVSTERLFQRRGTFWSIGPEIYIPVFSGGRNKSKLQISQSEYEEVLANYQQTVLRSLSEVETFLSSTKLLAIQEIAQNQAVAASREARATARDQYEGGVSDYLSLLDLERTALDAERSQAILLGIEYVNTVNLIRSLGGSW